MADEIGFFVSEAQFAPDVIAVELDGRNGHAEQVGDLLCRIALLDEGRNPGFLGGQIQILRVQISQERRDDVVEVRFDNAYVGKLEIRQSGFFELFQVG